MRTHTVLLPLLPAAALCRVAEGASTTTTQNENPPRGSVRIRDVQTSGSGCPPGSVSTQISADLTTVTIGMTKMAAYFGPDYRSSENLRNCEIHVDLNYPGGYQFSVMTATYNGYARLDPGVIGQLTSSYFFSHSPTRIKYTRTQIDGPQYELGNPFQKTDTANDKTAIWSTCGTNGILNVNDILSIASRNRQLAGEMNVFDATIRFTQEVFISWRRCARSGDFSAVEGGSSSGSSNTGSNTGGRPPSGKSSTPPKTTSKSTGQRPGRGGRGGGASRGQSWFEEEEYDQYDDEEYRYPPSRPAPPRNPSGTSSGAFGPIVYTNDIGDLRKVESEHELTDFKTELTNPLPPIQG